MSNDEIILEPLVITGKRADGRINDYLYFIPIGDDQDNVLMYIPILKNYNPVNRIKDIKEAIYKNYGPMDEEDVNQMKYLRKYIKDHLGSLVLTKNVKEMIITGLSSLTFREIYFLNLFLNYLGFPFFEENTVEIQ